MNSGGSVRRCVVSGHRRHDIDKSKKRYNRQVGWKKLDGEGLTGGKFGSGKCDKDPHKEEVNLIRVNLEEISSIDSS